MEPRYRCPKCPRVGTIWQLETHLAEQHYTFYPHHCRTCGHRTYDKEAIYEQCVPLKHKVVFWEVREEEQESHLEVEACLRHPVLVIESKAFLLSDDSLTEADGTGAPVQADAFVQDRMLPHGQDEVMDADMAEATQTITVAAKKRMLSKSGVVNTCFKRARNAEVHTTMTCGEEVAVRGKVRTSKIQKQHMQERHRPVELDIHCPVRRCKQRLNNVEYLSAHIGQYHNGINALSADELASYRSLQKRLLYASTELLPVCFPPGVTHRDTVAAKRTCRCIKCGKRIEAYAIGLRAAQKLHVARNHLATTSNLKCPVSQCSTRDKNYDSPVCLSDHMYRQHGIGTGSLSGESLASYRALRKEENAVTNTLLAECFPDSSESNGRGRN